jgi:hypothetical protein
VFKGGCARPPLACMGRPSSCSSTSPVAGLVEMGEGFRTNSKSLTRIVYLEHTVFTFLIIIISCVDWYVVRVERINRTYIHTLECAQSARHKRVLNCAVVSTSTYIYARTSYIHCIMSFTVMSNEEADDVFKVTADSLAKRAGVDASGLLSDDGITDEQRVRRLKQQVRATIYSV